jgi:hypothetical protein
MPGGDTGAGAVFSLAPPTSPAGAWSYALLKYFGGPHPDAQLVLRNGNLYGAVATPTGGVVFELRPPSSPGGAWTTIHLHEFTNYQVPFGQLIVDDDGTLYGTTGTVYGGPYSGTIYRIAPK